MNGKIRLFAGAVLLVLCAFLQPAFAAEGDAAEQTVIRVGFPIQKGLTEIDERGRYTGYTVEYLEEISEYTNWEYEYVTVGGNINKQLVTLLGMLQRGEIDLMGAMNYNDATAEMFLFPSYSYGMAYTVLSVREDNLTYIENDHQTLDGIRVAVSEEMENRLTALEQYAEVYGFDYVLQEYPDSNAAVQAVLDEQADACLQLDLNLSEGLRSISRFSPRPYYFAVTPKKPDLLLQLDNALSNLSQAYPHLQTGLYQQYFRGEERFRLSQQNTEYVASLEPLRVLFFDGNAPLQYVRDGEVKGVARTFIDSLCEATGLQYEPVVAANYEEGLRLIESGEVDLVGLLHRASGFAEESGLKLSSPYMESHSVLVYHEDASNFSEDAMPLFPDNAERELTQMNRTRDSSVRMDSYIVSFYLRKEEIFRHIQVNRSDIRNLSYALGFTSNVDDQLVGIINDYITSLDEDTVYDMIYSNSHERVKYTPLEWIYTFRRRLMVVLLALILLGYLSVRSKTRAVRRSQQRENERFFRLAQMLRECLFEYSYERDELLLQNNKILFQGQSLLKHFSSMNEQEMDESVHCYYQQLLRVFREKLSMEEFEMPKDGHSEWVRVEAKFMDHDGQYALGRISNITQEYLNRQKLTERAELDQLTGLYNRYVIERVVEAHLQDKEEQGIFLLLDIDNFKKVNDIHGHIAGDTLLREFSAELRHSFRSDDLKGRIGGDEFIVFMPGELDEATLREKLDRFMETLNNGIFASFRDCAVSVSIGAAYRDSETLHYCDLYSKADRAMYESKQKGKNDYTIAH